MMAILTFENEWLFFSHEEFALIGGAHCADPIMGYLILDLETLGM